MSSELRILSSAVPSVRAHIYTRSHTNYPRFSSPPSHAKGVTPTYGQLLKQ